jgi:predicted metal-binding membrane protein
MKISSILILAGAILIWIGIGLLFMPAAHAYQGLPPLTTGDGAKIAAIVMALCLVLAGLLGFETWALATGRAPITSYTRSRIREYPALAISIGGFALFTIGWLFAHFYTDAFCS